MEPTPSPQSGRKAGLAILGFLIAIIVLAWLGKIAVDFILE